MYLYTLYATVYLPAGIVKQTNAALSHVTTSRAITAARASVTGLTPASAGARCIPSDRSANPVSKVCYYLFSFLGNCGRLLER